MIWFYYEPALVSLDFLDGQFLDRHILDCHFLEQQKKVLLVQEVKVQDTRMVQLCATCLINTSWTVTSWVNNPEGSAILVTKTKTKTKTIVCYNTRIKTKLKGSGKNENEN